MTDLNTCPAADERLDYINEDLSLLQKCDGLTFGTDAYLLAAYVRPQKHARMAELGSGTGVASFLCAVRNKADTIYAIEIQEAFASLCARNIRRNALENRVYSVCRDIREIKAEDTEGELDIVIANPPYMRTSNGRRNVSDAKYAARHEVHGDIGDFAAAAARLLKYGGLFYTVYRPDRLTELLLALTAHTLSPKRITFVYPDAESAPSIVLVESKKGAAHGVSVTAPILIYTEPYRAGVPREYTPAFAEIYRHCQIPAGDKGGGYR